MTKVMILCMEKTGSSTVKRAIDSAGIVVDRVHHHTINDFDFNNYTHFITMVRSPIERAISHYFEYDMQNGLEDLEQEVDFTLTWFDEYIRPLTGVNAYSTFSYIKGWKVYSKKLLVIRTDELSASLSFGLAKLLNRKPEDFTIIHRNKGIEKFGNRYEQFIKETKFHSSFLNSIYRHKYCKMFWNDTENVASIKRWSK